MKILIPLALTLSLAISGATSAQALDQHISLHPQHIARDANFLILLEDTWPDGCGGRVTVTAQANLIDVLAVAAGPEANRPCTQALVPFKELIEPRLALAQGVEFAATVRVEYRFDSGGGAQLIQSEALVFSDAANAAIEVDTGTWSTPALENSGLFIDEQDGLLTAALFDYSGEGRSTWFYTGSMSNGSVFIAPIFSYSTVVCVAAPCPRAVPTSEGRVRMLMLDRSRMLVYFDDVLADSAGGEVLDYRRLDFERSEALVEVDLKVPDLIGHWVGGVSGSLGTEHAERSAGEFGEWWIHYSGSPLVSGLTEHVFAAYSQPLPPPVPNAIPPAPAFSIVCADRTAADGRKECLVEGFPHPSGGCSASFPFDAAGTARLSAAADCGDSGRAFTTEFHLFKLSSRP